MNFSLNKTAIMIPLLVAGFLVHNFAIQFGLNFKFHHLAIGFAVLFGIFQIKKTRTTIYQQVPLYFVAVFLTYSVFNIFLSTYGSESILYTVYLFIIILFSVIYISYSKLMIIHFNYTLKAFLLIFLIALIGYIYLFFFSSAEEIRFAYTQSLNGRKDLVNSVNAFVYPEYGGLFLRFNGYNLDPNFWGLFCIVSFWNLILFHEIAKRNFNVVVNTRLYSFTLTAIVLSLVLTFSRGTFLAFILSVLVYLLFSLDLKRIALFSLFALLGLVTIYFLYFNVEDVKQMIDIKIFSPRASSENPRLEKWVFYLDYIFSDSFYKFLFGYGITDLYDYHYGTTMHNTFIQLFIAYGFIAVILLLLYLVISLYLIFLKYIKRIAAIQLSLLAGTLFSAFFIDMLTSTAFWIGVLLPVYSSFLISEFNNYEDV